MTVRLDVYDVTNATKLGELTEAYRIGWIEDLVLPGAAMFTVDVASTDDLDLLQPRRVVRIVLVHEEEGEDEEVDVFACIVQDRPAQLAADIEPEPDATITTITFECPGLQSWLGYREGGATLWPYGGLEGRQSNPRLFGWFGADFADTGWGSPTPAGPLTTVEWPDQDAAAYEFTGERALYRRHMAANVDTAGPARMYIAATWMTAVTVYLDGEVVLEKPVGDTGVFYADVPYEDVEHLVAVEAVGGEGRWGFTWMRLIETVGPDGRTTFELGSVLRRTYDPADFPDASSPWLTVQPSEGTYPGVTVGYVLDLALTEANDRGHTPAFVWDFDAAEDSNGEPWEVEFSRGFRVQPIGRLTDELSSIEGEPRMTPDGTLQLFTRRGSDTAVTVEAPFDLRLAGRGPQATRWLFETDGGFGTIVNETAESDLGVTMEAFVQLGSDINPDAIRPSLVAQLERDGQTFDEADVDLPDDVIPYLDLELGDRFTCVGRDGPVTVRLTSVEGTVDDETGHVSWSTTVEVV